MTSNRETNTLKRRIHNYICKKQDILEEGSVDRNLIIELIIEKYKNVSKTLNESDDAYLGWIINDLVVCIGILNDLNENNDTDGVNILHDLGKKIYTNNVPNKHKIELLLYNDLPLYYLLSLLGIASYKEALNV